MHGETILKTRNNTTKNRVITRYSNHIRFALSFGLLTRSTTLLSIELKQQTLMYSHPQFSRVPHQTHKSQTMGKQVSF